MDIQQFYRLYTACNKVVIDSRKIERGDIFFAFSGDNFDAATQAQIAVNKGALAVVVEREEFADPSKNIIYKPSTLKFLQELAKYHRERLQIPVIGLTGSNGKTTTKELVSAVLAKKFRVQYTFGNLNNHIGVPLTLLSIRPEHEFAVIEMGANHQKEIELLCSIAKPDFGYITNFGKAHLEGFGGFEGVIKGKSELYDYLKSNSKTILVNEDDKIQSEKTSDYDSKITFGKRNSDYYFEKTTSQNFVGLNYQNLTAISHLTGDYNFTNLCAAATLGLHFGVSFSDIIRAFEDYVPTNMRSQVTQKDGKTLILDTYNANPSSMDESLKNFSNFAGTKTAIIGDMLELGKDSNAEHKLVMDLAFRLNFDEIITVGPHFLEVNKSKKAFVDVLELADYLKQNKIASKNILLKGSRGIALEKVIEFI